MHRHYHTTTVGRVKLHFLFRKMFHNVLMTTLAPLRYTNENHCWGNGSFNTIWPEIKQEKLKDTTIKKTIKKKKRNRTMFTTEQVKLLEKVFARSKYIDIERRREIAECLQIEQKCIKIWFQNRRMKEKKEISESCDSTSEDVAESLLPPLELSQPLNKAPNDGYTFNYLPSHTRPSQYNFHVTDNYKTELLQNELNKYETTNNDSPTEYYNQNYNNINPNEFMRSNIDYSAQYYPPQTELPYYYNTDEMYNQNVRSDIQDWPINVFDTSYL